MRYVDIETGEVLTRQQLEVEFEKLRAANETEAENVDDYISNCLEGSLEVFDEERTLNKINKLTDKIENNLNQLLSEIYEDEGITSGDISPMQSLEWDEIVGHMANLFSQLIEQNR